MRCVNVTQRITGQISTVTPVIEGGEIKASPDFGIHIKSDSTDATATAEDILEGKTAYVNGQKITGVYEPTEWIYLDETNNLEWYCDQPYDEVHDLVFSSCTLAVNCNEWSAKINEAVALPTRMEWPGEGRQAVGFNIYEFYKENGVNKIKHSFWQYDENGFVKNEEKYYQEI